MRAASFTAAGTLAVSLAALAGMAGACRADAGGYADPSACAGCHRRIWETCRRTGMGRSFYRAQPARMIEDFSRNHTFYHRASDRHYEMLERDGSYYQRRYQLDLQGSRINVVEKRIDYVLGSGNHARTYLSRTADGRLLDLPVAWYTEGGGYWAMAPGYDRPDHLDSRREITGECFFCHDAYPAGGIGTETAEEPLRFPGAIPEGIDCQRCHGPGQAHIEATAQGKPAATVRAAIVNPARLSAERQLEVCLQCHLESTTQRLPYAMRRRGRKVFSYRPGEPLADYILHFDLAPQGRRGDPFEVNHAAYRLMKSACFQKSAGKLLCTTCHDPHESRRGEQAARHYTEACLRCHQAKIDKLIASSRHTAARGCLGCHMPKRRTEDAVHVVMTDHYIQRRLPARDLLAPLAEQHASEDNSLLGEVVLLYPPRLPRAVQNELDLAVAQVKESANLEAGIPRLEKLIEKYRPAEAGYYYELANAWRNAGRPEQAIPLYEEARRRQPDFQPGLRNFALALAAAGRLPAAVETLEAARTLAPDDAPTLNMLGSFYTQQGQPGRAAELLRRAVACNPDLPEARVNLGVALTQLRDGAGAEKELREAVRIAPDFAVAQLNLGLALAGQGKLAEARFYLEKAASSAEPQARRAAGEALAKLPRE
ncbi:MAG TPA: tetratricopeptide repeat protein [Bryobacterales bacterium]|nr:tetratricopeptide repeat protein [Bryobacterales bacterium]